MTGLPFRGWLRTQRYALPAKLGRWLRAPTARDAARHMRRLGRRRMRATLGYFQDDDDAPDRIVAACRAAASAAAGSDAWLSVKAPPLHFDAGRLRKIAEAAAAHGLPLMFDAHAPADADATLAGAEALAAAFPGTGAALPARWHRSLADAARLRDAPIRLRIVKGEWGDGDRDPPDLDTAYLALVERLAGRRHPVSVATHKPALAAAALDCLIAAGTPCELEQLRGLPRRRSSAAARARGVPVRIYLPFGPGWWPYAIDKVLARPWLPIWWLRDRLGLPDPGTAAPAARGRTRSGARTP